MAGRREGVSREIPPMVSSTDDAMGICYPMELEDGRAVHSANEIVESRAGIKRNCRRGTWAVVLTVVCNRRTWT